MPTSLVIEWALAAGTPSRALAVKSLVSCWLCCLWQGDGEFGDAVGVDDVPADTPGDAVDDAVGGEGRLGGGGQVDCADSGDDLRLADDEGLAGVHAAGDEHGQAEQGALGLDGRAAELEDPVRVFELGESPPACGIHDDAGGLPAVGFDAGDGVGEGIEVGGDGPCVDDAVKVADAGRAGRAVEEDVVGFQSDGSLHAGGDGP